MITRLHVEKYKALRDVSLELTPVHALIGPNDSGKTSVLNAIAALSRTTDYLLEQAFAGAWEGRELVSHGDASGVIRLEADCQGHDSNLRYMLAVRFPNAGRNATVERETITRTVEMSAKSEGDGYTRVYGVCKKNKQVETELGDECRAVHRALSGVQYFRWNPRTLALPVAPDVSRNFRLNSDGFGLALLLDDILGFDRQRFIDLESRVKAIFPEVTSIKLQRQKGFRAPPDDIEQVSRLDRADGKGIYFEIHRSSQLVPASQVSDGLLMVLGYLAILFSPQPPRLLLIDEPENGIHPKRLQDVLGILREAVKAQSETQVLLTTHSPYAVSLFEANEVTLCTKQNGDVKTRRLSDSKLVQDQSSIFTLGEIWTAEGDEELAQDHALTRS